MSRAAATVIIYLVLYNKEFLYDIDKAIEYVKIIDLLYVIIIMLLKKLLKKLVDQKLKVNMQKNKKKKKKKMKKKLKNNNFEV